MYDLKYMLTFVKIFKMGLYFFYGGILARVLVSVLLV